MESFIVYFDFLHFAWTSFMSLLINTLLNLFIFFSINWSFYWFDMVAYLSFLFIIFINRQRKSIVKSRNLWPWCKNFSLFEFGSSILISLRLWFFRFVSTFLIKYFGIFSNFLWSSFTLSAKMVRLMIFVMFSCTMIIFISWDLRMSLNQWMRVVTRLCFEKRLLLSQRLMLLSSFLLLDFVLLWGSKYSFRLLCSHY